MDASNLPRVSSFPLIRYFIVWSIIAAIMCAAGLGIVASVEVKADLRKKDSRFADMVADVIQRQVNEHFPDWLKTHGGTYDPQNPEHVAMLKDIVTRNIENLGIKRVNFFDKTGKVLFSTESDVIGKVFADKGVELALQGITTTDFLDEDEDGPESPKDVELLESYIPAHLFASRGAFGDVVEIYQEAAPYVNAVRDSQFRIIRTAVSGLVLYFIFNWIIVRRGARDIESERKRAMTYQAELEKTNAALAELTQKLEERVKEATSSLVKTERLAVVGRLAAGMAHEVNTPLASIAACAEGLQRRKEPMPDAVKRSIEIIRSEAFRCKQITRNLLDFARRDTGAVPEKFDVAKCLRETTELVGFEFEKRGVLLNVEWPETPLRSMGHPNEIKQVFLNVLRNAAQASESGATVRVTVRASEQSIDVVCKDDGHGIAREDLDKIFEPFFTTKAPGEGTGLGLAVSYGIIERHDGRMRVESPGLGLGATVTVSLPKASA